jgi:hypothetical protein
MLFFRTFWTLVAKRTAKIGTIGDLPNSPFKIFGEFDPKTEFPLLHSCFAGAQK